MRRLLVSIAAVLLLLDFEADFLALAQAAQAGFLHGTYMHEDVLAPGLRGNEAVAFGRVEPLNGALGHRRVAFLPAGNAHRRRRHPIIGKRNGSAPRRFPSL